MPERLKAVLDQLRGFWEGLSTSRRVVLVGGISLVGGLILLLSVYGSSVNYGYLYTELEPADAAKIVEELEKKKVPYEVAAGGSAIKVPRDRVYALRVELAGDGLPRGGGKGFEIFDESSVGDTEFVQHVKKQRALEGELSRSIATLDGVAAARVHLVMPRRSLFARKEDAAKASVVLKLRNPGAFEKRQVAAIVHLVATAVPGLSREHVSVVSTDGRPLFRPSQGGTDLDGLGEDAARKRASELEQQVREQLEKVVGPGNADVRVALELDESVRKQVSEKYYPEQTALRSEQVQNQSSGNAANEGAGIPGAMSNVPEPGPAAAPPEGELSGPGAQASNASTSRIRNWEVSVDKTTVATPAGALRRLSVAVLLNGRYVEKDGQQVYKPRTEKEMDELTALVRSAVPFNKERGDTIQVSSAEFVKAAEESALVTAEPWWMKYWPYAAAALAALVFLLVLVVLLRRGKKKKPAELPAVADGDVEQLEGIPDAPALGALNADEAAAMLETGKEASDEEDLDFRVLALDLATKDPATAAVVLRKWLNQPSTSLSQLPAAGAALPEGEATQDAPQAAE